MVVVFMPIFESSRKVQVFGTSLAMTLPAFFVKANEIKKGSVLKVLYDLDGTLIVSLIENPESVKKSITSIIEKLEEITKNSNTK